MIKYNSFHTFYHICFFLCGLATAWAGDGHVPASTFDHGGNGQGHLQELNVNYQLYQRCRSDLEGYSEMLSGAEFFTYPSLREDVNVSMIARATTGEMGFELLTGTVPTDFKPETATFAFLSDIDLNQRHPFAVYLNGTRLLTFQANEDGTLRVSENPDQAQAEFLLTHRDANGDGLGLFRLTVPAGLLAKGAKARLRFVGHRKHANAWFMIFKADDVVERLRRSVESEAAFAIRERDGQLFVDAPAHFAGKPLYLVSDGKQSATQVLKPIGNFSSAALVVNIP